MSGQNDVLGPKRAAAPRQPEGAPACAQPERTAAFVRPRRADACRNYDALLNAAIAAFATQGTDVALEDIAAAAGVGIGTLYRNFPSRQALVVAVYRQGVEQLCDSAQSLQAEHPGDLALQLWLQQFIGYMTTKRMLTNVLRSAADDHAELFAAVRERIISVLGELIGAAVATGRVRDDIDAEDIIRAISGICLVSDQPGSAAQASRLLELLMDGLRYGARG